MYLDKNLTERINLKIVDFSSDFGSASLKLTIELAKKDKDGVRSGNIFRSTYNSIKYNKTVSLESLTLSPSWYLTLACKSKKDSSRLSPLRDNIMILPKQIYKLIEMLTVMKNILTKTDDLFISNGSILNVNPKYYNVKLLYEFGLPNSKENITGELASFCEYEGTLEKPSFLLMLNGDYTVSFYMTLEDINGVLFLLEKTDFVSLALNVTSTLGVSENNIKTISRKSSALFGIEVDDLQPAKTIMTGNGDNVVKRLTNSKNDSKGIKVLWD